MIYEVSTLWDNTEISLIRERSVNYPDESMNTPDAIYRFCTKELHLEERNQEYLYAFFFDQRYRFISYTLVSKGTVNASLIDPKTLFSTALLSGAVNMILVHNHPSGDYTPSGLDDSITEKISNCGKLLDIQISDHLIIGDGNYYSYRMEGKLY